jgi:hypothetical protein
MKRILLAAVALPAALLAQKLPDLNDGEPHGDAPYLLESGWRPLLNGRDLSGWHGRDDKPFEWMTVRGVRWERLLAPTRLSPSVREPSGTIMNGPNGRTTDLVTGDEFGDMELYLEFLIPKGSNSGVYLHGLYEVQIFDSYGTVMPLSSSDGGGIYHRWIDNKGVGGSAPKVNACRRPGEWQSYQIWFRAPRFDANGRKVENAKFIRVLYNGLLVQENVEIDGPTRAAMSHPEAAHNPLMLQGDHGPVAFRNIYVHSLRPIIER